MKIKIVADSACDIYTLDGIDFTAVPLNIHSEEREFIDSEELNVDEMSEYFAHLKARSYTSCPNTSEWLASFGAAERIFVFTITSALSGSYSAAMAAKAEYEEKNKGSAVYVFDTLSAGAEMLLLIEKLRAYLLTGLDCDEAAERIRSYQKKTALLFCLESLNNFAQNGRVSRLAAAACEALGVRVVGKASSKGTLELVGKCRGAIKAVSLIFREMEKAGYRGGNVNIGYCVNRELALEIKKQITSRYENANVKYYPMHGLCCYYAQTGGILVGFEKGE